MKKFLLTAIILLAFCSSALADGMSIRPCIESGWCPNRETSQSAIINYENGFENLLLFVKTENSDSNKFLWLFPVPAKPETIEITNLKNFPLFSGTPLKKTFNDNLGILAALNFFSVCPPVGFFAFLFFVMSSSTSMSIGEMQATGGKAIDRGYDIYQHIDKYGIATEVMSATESEKFYHYLEVRGTNVTPEMKQRLDEYIGKDYSFVVSWISNPEEYRQQNNSNYYNTEPIGVFARFPTEKIYYPMKLTSIYANNYVPAYLYIIGYWEPQVFSNISEETKTEYYYQDRLQYSLANEESALKIFNANIPQQARYTKVTINAQAKYFTEDIFIQNKSLSAGLFETINAIWLLLAILIYFGMSYLTISIVNQLVLAGFLNQKRKAVLSLSNFFTIIGFICAVFLLKELLKGEEKQKFSRARTILGFWLLFIAFSIVFGIAVIIITSLIK